MTGHGDRELTNELDTATTTEWGHNSQCFSPTSPNTANSTPDEADASTTASPEPGSSSPASP